MYVNLRWGFMWIYSVPLGWRVYRLKLHHSFVFAFPRGKENPSPDFLCFPDLRPGQTCNTLLQPLSIWTLQPPHLGPHLGYPHEAGDRWAPGWTTATSLLFTLPEAEDRWDPGQIFATEPPILFFFFFKHHTRSIWRFPG